MRARLEKLRSDGNADAEQIRQLEDLIHQMETMESMSEIFEPVGAYLQKLSATPRDKQTARQKLWLLAYAYVDDKMKTGTTPAMVEVARLMPILYETIE